MGAQSLLSDDIERGKRTLAALDAAGLDIHAAFWVLDEDTETWRFSIADPTVDATGTHAVYGQIARAVDGKPDLVPLRDIYVVSPNDQLVSLVRMAITTPSRAISGIPFRGNVVMGTRVPDMYIYRMDGPSVGIGAP